MMKNKNFTNLLLAGFAVCSFHAFAQGKEPKKSLQSDLDSLSAGSELQQSPKEHFYVVQDRQVGLAGRWLLMANAGHHANSDIYVSSYEGSAQIGYNFTDRFFTKLSASFVKNKLTQSANDLWEESGLYPDTSFVRDRFDGVLGFNLIYGKARVTSDSVFYFDQYIAIGGGVVDQDNQLETYRVPATVADIGLSIWFNRTVGMQLGAKDHYFQERRRLSSNRVHHVVAYSGVGVLL